MHMHVHIYTCSTLSRREATISADLVAISADCTASLQAAASALRRRATSPACSTDAAWCSAASCRNRPSTPATVGGAACNCRWWGLQP